MELLFTWRILLATAATMALGFLWYAPQLFGKRYFELTGLAEEMKGQGPGMAKQLGLGTLAMLIASFVLAQLTSWVGVNGWLGGIGFGAIISIGLLFTYGASRVLWEQQPVQLYMINRGYEFVSVILICAILAA